MSLAVLSLVLAAAFAHAGWNFLAKGAEGGAAFVWLCAALGVLLYVPVLAIALASTSGQLTWEALGLMAGSGMLHSIYFVLLQRGYATGDLSLVYPLARGTGPLLSGAAAIAFLGERPSALALAGALTIVAAVLSFVVRPGDSLRHGARGAIVFALLTGVAIASYTLWDRHAVGPVHLSPVVYNWGSQVVVVLILTPFVLRGDRLRVVWAGSRGRATGVGVLSPLAYVLVLYALARAPVSAVAPARETSILIGTLLGTTVLAEGDGRRRMIVAGAILLGVTALALG
ncbi:MAG: EamA family transporter [Solirubrobacteraceae bacterium]